MLIRGVIFALLWGVNSTFLRKKDVFWKNLE
jgi:hypothetical protein